MFSKLWKALEGNKTKIGFGLLSVGKLVSTVKPEIGVPLVVAGYVIGGVGIADALRRAGVTLSKGE